MKASEVSFIIPIYNRPEEAQELLKSFTDLEGPKDFEIVIVEDGSTISSEAVVKQYQSKLNISYYFKENSGPGDSRNYGMRKAKGSYFIILDSDCVLPQKYLSNVIHSLQANYVDCFGGPDAAHQSFTPIQKAINFAMTSFMSTGGIRGKKSSINKFQPRSFNMGLSKKAFEATNGFGRVHPGEDPDLSIRLWDLGFETKLIPEAHVFHKRRISWSKFYKQVNKFGSVRPILNKWHPQTRRITYWFPSLFCLGFLVSILLLTLKIKWPMFAYGIYFLIAFISALWSTKHLMISFMAIWAICIQFVGYGYGFIRSTLILSMANKEPEELFPNLFFKVK